MKLFSEKLWRICAVVSSSLLVVSVAGTRIAVANSTAINETLNIKTFDIVKGEDDGETDTEYYKSTHTTKDSLKSYCEETGKLIEAEGLVLLKNENDALPLKEGDKVSCFGQASVAFNYTTSGSSSSGNVEYPSFQSALTASGLSVNGALTEFYSTGAGKAYRRGNKNLVNFVNEAPWNVYDANTINSVESYGDAAIVTFARNSGEGSDVSVTGTDGEDGSYLSITPQEEQLLQELTKLKAQNKIKKIIVLLNSAVPIELDFLYRDAIDVDACMWIGNVGTSGIYSVADALVGEVVPSGRITDTFCRDNFSSPAMANWILNPSMKFSQRYTNYKDYSLNDTQQYYAVYTESIYVGYRYYETRYEDSVTGRENVGSYDYGEVVAYPFGYGESYAEFEYSDFSVQQNKEGNFDVSVTVTNTSKKNYSGKEVVQFYIQKPYTDYDAGNGVEKAAVELVDFAKTPVIAPNKSETVTLTIDKEEFKSYDSYGYGTYILDAGKYYVTAAKNAHDAVNNILAAKGYGLADGMDSAGDAALAKLAFENSELDHTTYAVSSETGKPITNQLDFMDINRYSGKGSNGVTYLTRSDWTGTWPQAAVTMSVATEEMSYDLTSHKELPEDATAKMPEYGQENGLVLAMLRGKDYDDELWDSLLDQMSFGEQALLLTSAQYSTAEIISVSKPATKDNDGPMGIVGTQTGTAMPSEGVWAATFNRELIERVGASIAEDAALIDYSSLYAPGVNIHRVPFGGRAGEYFSEDSCLSGIACTYAVKGLQSRGVIPTVKHYAFNNEETNRNGVGIWMNEQEAREIYLKPFEITFRPSVGNSHGVMTSFNRAGCIWTSASPELMINIMRDEWDFDGYSLTDMASSNGKVYMTYDDGIMNGTDLFLGAGAEDSLDSYKTNAAYCQRMRESCHRVLYSICNYSRAMNGISSSDRVVFVTPWWKTTLYTVIGISAFLTLGTAVMMGLSIAFKNNWLKRKSENETSQNEETEE